MLNFCVQLQKNTKKFKWSTRVLCTLKEIGSIGNWYTVILGKVADYDVILPISAFWLFHRGMFLWAIAVLRFPFDYTAISAQKDGCAHSSWRIASKEKNHPSALVSHLSYLSCFMSLLSYLVSYLSSLVSCLLSLTSCLSSLISCLSSLISCLFISHLLYVSSLLSRLPSPDFHLLSPLTPFFIISLPYFSLHLPPLERPLVGRGEWGWLAGGEEVDHQSPTP